MSRTNYYPQLDSIRGLSFLAIFFFHAAHPEFGESMAGRLLGFCYDQLPLAIDVFFILSSFLLTWLGIKEYKKQQKVSLAKFFQRRILRIWPLYFLFLTVCFLLFPSLAAKAGTHITLPDPLYYYLFIANFYKADHVFFLQILWTISVEEQFYIFLGLMMRFFFRYLPVIFVALVLCSLGFTVYAKITGLTFYFHTLTYCADFAMGGLAALLLSKKSSLINWTEKLNGSRAVVFYCWPLIQLTSFFLISEYVHHYLVLLVNRYLFVAYICLLLIEQLNNPGRIRFYERNRFLILTGRISFGLYCFHGLSITAFQLLNERFNSALSPWLLVPLIFAFNFGLAFASYRYFESPFLRLKDRLRVV